MRTWAWWSWWVTSIGGLGAWEAGIDGWTGPDTTESGGYEKIYTARGETMSEEIRHFVQQQLPHFLNPIRQVENPSVFHCETELKDPLSEGDIRLIPVGECEVPELAFEYMIEKLQELNIPVTHSPHTFDGSQSVRFKLRPETVRTELCKFAAPWYVNPYCQSPDTPKEIMGTAVWCGGYPTNRNCTVQ